MPTYQYECTKCGTITEIFQSITEPARKRFKKKDDSKCDCKADVTRLIGTGAGVIFRGSGFYQTDYRSDAYKKAAKADKESGESKSKTDSDSKASKKNGSTNSDTKPKQKPKSSSSDE